MERKLGAVGRSLLALGFVLAIGLVGVSGVIAARRNAERHEMRTELFWASDLIPAGLPGSNYGDSWFGPPPTAPPPAPELVPLINEIKRRVPGPWPPMTIQVDPRKRGFVARGTVENLDDLRDALAEMRESRRLTR